MLLSILSAAPVSAAEVPDLWTPLPPGGRGPGCGTAYLSAVPEVRTKPALGELEAFSPGSSLLLVDYTGRLCRQGKARLSWEAASMLERLRTSAEVWGQRMRKLFGKARLLGS